MADPIPAFQLPSIASGKKPTAIGEPVGTLMPNVASARPVYTGTVVPAPAFSSLRSEPAVGYPA